MEQRTRARELRSNATASERALWKVLSARKIAGVRFNRQVPLGPFICDFVARTARLITEVDGGQHATDAAEDARRTSYLEARGFTVIRFWNNDVLANIEGVAETITQSLAGRPSPNPSRKREGN